MSGQRPKLAGGRACRGTAGWVPNLVPRRGFEPAGGGIASCRPGAGIPGAGLVLAQKFEGVMK